MGFLRAYFCPSPPSAAKRCTNCTQHWLVEYSKKGRIFWASPECVSPRSGAVQPDEGSPELSVCAGDPSLRLKDGCAQDDAEEELEAFLCLNNSGSPRS